MLNGSKSLRGVLGVIEYGVRRVSPAVQDDSPCVRGASQAASHLQRIVNIADAVNQSQLQRLICSEHAAVEHSVHLDLFVLVAVAFIATAIRDRGLGVRVVSWLLVVSRPGSPSVGVGRRSN